MNLNLSGLSGFFSFVPAELVAIVIGLLAIVQLIIIVLLAVAVMDDARQRQQMPGGLFLVSPLMWFFVVVFTGGYLGALGYWFIHYSAQRYRP